jgi:hypothetical protein
MMARFAKRCVVFGHCGAFAVFGCAPQPPQAPTPAIPSSRNPAPMDSANRTSDFLLDVYRPGSIHYDFQLISTIQSIAGDSIPRTDSTRITAVLTETFGTAVPPQAVIDATLKADSILVVTTPGAVSDVALQTQFVPLRLDRLTGKIASAAPTITECTQSTVAFIFRGDEAVPAIPRSVSFARSWADTSASEVCRGGVRLQFTRIARYRIEESAINPLEARILRLSDIQVKGSGSQWQQPVQVNGEGSSIDTLIVNRDASRIQRISGRSHLNLEFQSPIRVQRFLQTSTTTITARLP